MSSDKPNPYQNRPYGSWWFDDKNNVAHGPYDHQSTALFALLEFMEKQRIWRERSEHARRQNQNTRKAADGL